MAISPEVQAILDELQRKTEGPVAPPPAVEVPMVKPAPAPEPEIPPSMSVSSISRTCTCCGWNTSTVWAPVYTDDFKVKLLRAIATGKRFEHTYPLFSGAISITFRSITRLEARAAFDLAIRSAGPTQAADLVVYELAASLVSFGSDDNPNTYVNYAEIDSVTNPLTYEQVVDSLTKRTATILDRWPVPLFATIQREYGRFNNTIYGLIAKSTDPDFWKATRLQAQ